MAYNPNNPNGQATMANSQPVVIASDQSTINTSDVSVVSQGTATASLKGYLELGAASNNAPSYTNGQANPLSLTLAGGLRVDGSAVTQPISGSVSVSNFPATQTISGTVSVTQSTASNLNATVVGTGTFAVQADTELPAASALSDGATNPTTPTAGAANLGFNGTTWDRLKTQDAMAGNGANNTITGILAANLSATRYNPTALATAANSTSAFDIEGYNTICIGISTTTTGTIIFEGTQDNTNWYSIETFDAGADIWVTGQSLTPTTGKVYYIACSGLRQVRIRVVSTLGATVSHFTTLTNGGQVLSAIDTGYAPHNFGYTLVHKDVEYTTAQTGTVIWTPTTGKKFAITDITITTGGTTGGLVTIFDAASATTTYTAGTTPAIFRGNFIPSATSTPGVVKSFNVPYVSTTANNVVHITTSAAMTVYIQINGYEI